MKEEVDIVQKKEVKAVLFDLDGTLVDSFEVWFNVYNNSLEEFGRKKLTKGELRKRFGFPIEQDIKDYFHNATEKELIDCYNRHFPNYVKKIKLISGALDILRFLRKNKIKTALVSNSSRKIVDSILDHLKIRRYLSQIITLEDVKQRKPEPDMLLKACKLLKIKPQESIYIGDVKNDMIAGKKAGCTTIGYRIKGNYKINKLSRIIKHLG